MKSAAALTCSLLATTLASTAARAAELVVFCTERTGACAAGRPLGKAGEGWWSATDDGALTANGPLPRILYFSMSAYDDAIAGLTEKEKQQVILKRAKESSSLSSDLLTQLYADCFELAVAGADDPAIVGVALDGALMLAGGADRFGDASLETLYQETQRSLATLRQELPAHGAVADGYRSEAEALDDLETGRGGKGERFFPPPDPKRVYFIPGQKVAKGFDGELPDLQAFGWHGGAVSTMRPEEAAAVKGRQPKLLYYSSEMFQADRSGLTDAQLDRRLRARLRGVPAREQTTLAARLGFGHAVLIRQYGATFGRRAPASLAGWNNAVRSDPENLRLLLAAARRADADVKKAEARLRADVALAEAAFRSDRKSDPNLPTIERIAAVVAKLPPEN